MKLGLLIALALAVSLPGAQAQETLRERLKARAEQRRAEKVDAPIAKGGLQELQVQELQVQGRTVLVHLPARHDATRPAPLVLAFHGGGGHAAYMADDEKYGLQKKADEAGFVVAFPNGYSKLPGGKFATWNAGGCCGDARDRNVDDVGFARAVVAAIQARYAIDASRVFATGMSNGGMLSHRLACEAADVFRAVASVAGTDANSDCRPSRPIAVLHIHAKDDDHVLFNGGAEDHGLGPPPGPRAWGAGAPPPPLHGPAAAHAGQTRRLLRGLQRLRGQHQRDALRHRQRGPLLARRRQRAPRQAARVPRAGRRRCDLALLRTGVPLKPRPAGGLTTLSTLVQDRLKSLS
jgi:poly(3-hydroxybutyrate) depolymerase